MASHPSASYLLPTELWHHVLQEMRLQPLGLDPVPPSAAFCSRRSALRELCLTSRWFAALARPYLYETVVLFVSRRMEQRQGAYAAGARSVLLLARTLAQNHELRPLIRNLALPIPLSPGSPGYSALYADAGPVWRDLCSFLPHLKPADRAIFDAVDLSIPSADDSVGDEINANSARHLKTLAPRLVAALINMTCRVDRLLLQGLLVGQSQEFNQKVQKLIDRSDANTPFLPDLKTLQVQADSSTMTGDGGYYWQASSQAQVSLPLLNHPRLHSIHVACNWIDDLTVSRNVLKGITRIKEMDLTVITGLARIETLIRLATGVKSLSLTLQSPRPPLPQASERESDLNEMLLSRAETLESFSLDTTLCSAGHTADQLGPLDKLICLPKMHQLKSLSVEPHLLINWLEVNTWPRFLNTLPPNLVQLTFRFVPERGEDLLRIWARSGLGAVLRFPREKWQSKLPHLRHIHLNPLPFSLRTVEVIKEDLAECGITLTWQHLEADDELPLDLARLTIH
jgi:hypothetical protein